MAGEPIWRPRHWPESHLTGITLLAATVVMAIPLWSVWAPAMPDYPAHLASFALIDQVSFHHGASGAADGKIYHLHWAFVPNLASEVLVPLLAQLVGLVAATKLFLTAAIFLWVMGPGAIHRALYGRTGIAPLFGAFFAYNANFVWGFFNYYFAAGLSFAILAGWIATEGRAQIWRLAGFTVAVTILYFCHLFAAASLLLMLAGFELAQNWRLENANVRLLAARAARIALLYLPAALAFFLLKPATAEGAGFQFNLLETMQDRYESLIQYAFDQSAYLLPALLFCGLAIALLLRKARLHPAMTITLALLLLGALLAPEWALGGWAVHLRLPAVFGAMLFASAQLPMGHRVRTALAFIALGLIGWNSWRLTQSWLGYDKQYREFQAALEEIPRGSRILTVLDGNAIGDRSDQPYWHMAEFAIPERGVFTPLLFTTRGQHVVQLSPSYAARAAASAEQGSPPDVDELAFLARGDMDADEDMKQNVPYLNHFQCYFDLAVLVHLDGKRTPVPPMLKLRHAGSFFSLYDILPDRSCR
ncbi:MAG TPA: hypothetical protein VFA87_05545 [Rhizomicrobium sp.]|nr:hypothetical protein [Rhizomicrobium sp.]